MERHGDNFDADIFFVPSLAQATFHSILMDRSLIAIPSDRTIIPKDVMLAIALATSMKTLQPNLISWHFDAALDHGKLKSVYVGKGISFSYLSTPYVDRPNVTIIRCTDRLALDYNAPDKKLVDVVVFALLPAAICIGESNTRIPVGVTDRMVRERQFELMKSNRTLCARILDILQELDLRNLPATIAPDLVASKL